MLKEFRRTTILYITVLLVVAGLAVVPRVMRAPAGTAGQGAPTGVEGRWFGIAGGLTLATLLDPSQDITLSVQKREGALSLDYRMGARAHGNVPAYWRYGSLNAVLPAGVLDARLQDGSLRGTITPQDGPGRSVQFRRMVVANGWGNVTAFSLFCLQGIPSLGADLARQASSRVVTSVAIYLPIAGLALACCWLAGDGWFSRRRIQGRPMRTRTVLREFALSLNAIVALAAMGILTALLVRSGSTRVYTDIAARGMAYFMVSILLYLVLQDFFFYWIHRALHTKHLYRWAHQTHHVSIRPTPMTTFQISAHEVAVVWIMSPAILMILPLHPMALLVGGVISVGRQVVGHLGHEIFPRSMLDGPFRRSTTVTHHDMHHQHFRCNYGFYFSYWDWAMGTMHPEYRNRFAAVTAGPADNVAPILRAPGLRITERVDV